MLPKSNTQPATKDDNEQHNSEWRNERCTTTQTTASTDFARGMNLSGDALSVATIKTIVTAPTHGAISGRMKTMMIELASVAAIWIGGIVIGVWLGTK